ncbi:hypothetical protein EBR21_12750, partial [bacterium]|nr:hypothetical protein [bacterium]
TNKNANTRPQAANNPPKTGGLPPAIMRAAKNEKPAVTVPAKISPRILFSCEKIETKTRIAVGADSGTDGDASAGVGFRLPVGAYQGS